MARPSRSPQAERPPLAGSATTRAWRRRVPFVLGALTALISIAFAVTFARPRGQALTPVVTKPAAYVDNRLCLGCHEQAARDWQGSHHALAMAAPDAATVRGDFKNRRFTHRGITTTFFKKGEAYVVNTEGPDGKLADFEIKYTFGVEPLQQYLIELPGGRLQPLGIAWDSNKKRWFHLFPDEKLPPGDVLHWTGRYQTANTMCLVCHTTEFSKNYDPVRGVFASSWTEPNVSCQSCHGPGERHVARETALRRAGTPLPETPGEPRGLTVDFKGANARRKTELCAPCHSRRTELTPRAAPGEPLFDHYIPSLLADGLYYPDGQQREEVYVDASFRQSLMFERGVTCTHCHNPHTGKTRGEGNAVCLQCHGKDPNPGFPSATGDFDSPSHHFHKVGSPGASCAACHMPSTTYMQVQPRPDHSVRIPRPDLSAKVGAPDACSNCHKDRTPAWAAQAVARWYGPVRKQGSHYGEAFAASRAGKDNGPEALAALLPRLDLPPVVRASALSDLQHHPSAGVEARMKAALDPDPEIRVAAADSALGLSVDRRVQVLTPLLRDPVRAVRITAARNLSSLPREQIGESNLQALDAALNEYIEAQKVALDMPGAHFNLALVYENTSRRDLAEAHYLAALAIDPDFTVARANLAQLYTSLSRNHDAERILVAGLERRPDIGELQYSLGLLLGEGNRMPEAVKALGRAAALLPTRPDVHYNYGLALDHTGQREKAEQVLLEAHRLDPQDPAPPYALAILYKESGRKQQALQWAIRLKALKPGDPQVDRLIRSLQFAR